MRKDQVTVTQRTKKTRLIDIRQIGSGSSHNECRKPYLKKVKEDGMRKDQVTVTQRTKKN
jgi:hypothetical protein